MEKDDRFATARPTEIADIWSRKIQEQPRNGGRVAAEEGKSAMSIVASRWTLNDPGRRYEMAGFIESLCGNAPSSIRSTIAAKDYALALGWPENRRSTIEGTSEQASLRRAAKKPQ